MVEQQIDDEEEEEEAKLCHYCLFEKVFALLRGEMKTSSNLQKSRVYMKNKRRRIYGLPEHLSYFSTDHNFAT
jgi:hypothetical protein